MSSLPDGLEVLVSFLKQHDGEHVFKNHCEMESELGDGMNFIEILLQKHKLKKVATHFLSIAILTPPRDEANRDEKGRFLQTIRFYKNLYTIDVSWNRSGCWKSELEWDDEGDLATL